ncbi:MAG: hypothetical protein J1F67_03195 [Muribaculaceae bacterium]|nr:hypothetical protein [Muribaculaceae bacterium]
MKKIILISLFLSVLVHLKAEEVVDAEQDKVLMADQRISAMKDNTNALYSGEKNPSDSLERLLNIFYYDQFRHFQDPRAPYFMFLSKNGDLALGVGGQVKVRGYFDWNGSIPNVGFIPYDIPIPKNPAEMQNLSASASGTGLFFTLLGNNKLLGNFMAYFQADFSGYNHRGFRIKKAYITIRDWTAGYATTTFEDTQAEPSTVDGAGPNGINSKKNVLVRYLHQFKKNWKIAGSIEFPSESVSADGTHTAACNPYIPDFAAFVQYQWNGGANHLRLSGLLRTLSYRDLIAKRNHNITGWGLQLSTVINPLYNLNLFGILSTGQGHASYTTDLGNGDFDLIPVEGHEGKLYAPWAAGLVVGAQYYFNQKIFMNLAFSEQTYYPKPNPHDSQYKYGLYAVGNIFWDITPRFEVGLEYLHGKRKNFNGESGSANRLMAMFLVSF